MASNKVPVKVSNLLQLPKSLKVPKILFFDSGMGGLSVLSEVRKLNPGAA